MIHTLAILCALGAGACWAVALYLLAVLYVVAARSASAWDGDE